MHGISTIILLIILGLIPSFVWLTYYFKKDSRPEPKYLLLKTFFLGIILAPLAVVAQWIFPEIVKVFNPEYFAPASLIWFLWGAFAEEVTKLWAVQFTVLRDPEFDEPVDAMVYMVAAGLGFAAIENILALFQAIPSGISGTLQTWFWRFIGATLLHAVSSAMIGYFLALSWFYNKHSKKLVWTGLGIATLIHFTFNMIILSGADAPAGDIRVLYYSTSFLIVIAGLISFLFNKTKKRWELRKVVDNSTLS
ncbi:MAG: PrsW family intramembrane metalloprotease [Candidatus Paceibacterota bacterium]